MAFHARELLEQAGMAAEIEAAVLKAACPGAGLYLTAHYENSLAGFGAQGKRGKPAEQVAGGSLFRTLAPPSVGCGPGTASRRSADSSGCLVPGRIHLRRRTHQFTPHHQRLGG